MNLSKPKAILFDWDNTLADTWPTIYQSMCHTFKEMGKEPWSFEETKQRVHRSMREYFPDIFGNDWEKAADLYLSFFRANHIKELAVLEGALEVLDHLHHDDGIYVALVSNKTGCNLRKEVTHLGWDHYFQKVIGAKDAKEDKPSPAPIHMALAGSGIEPDEHVWLIGDSVTDLECAHNAGITPIFYGDADPTEERFHHCPPKKHLKNHSELLAFLKTLEPQMLES